MAGIYITIGSTVALIVIMFGLIYKGQSNDRCVKIIYCPESGRATVYPCGQPAIECKDVWRLVQVLQDVRSGVNEKSCK